MGGIQEITAPSVAYKMHYILFSIKDMFARGTVATFDFYLRNGIVLKSHSHTEEFFFLQPLNVKVVERAV